MTKHYNRSGLEFIISSPPYRLDHDISCLCRTGNKSFYGQVVQGKIEMSKLAEGEELSPFVTMELSDMQNLYLSLGKFLSEKRVLPLDGQFESQSKHLDDMRKIVFKKLGIND